MSNDKITQDVTSQLVWDGRVDSSNLDVDVENGEVTLSGTVPSNSARIAAVEDAVNVVGVDKVEDQIKVKIPDVDKMSDGDIKANLIENYAWNADLKRSDLRITVENSWVTLEGNVGALWKSYLAENEAMNTLGVVGVTNKLSVAPDDEFTDKYIAQSISNAIDRDSRVQLDSIAVEVEDGLVRLFGTVHQQSARVAAHHAAINTAGAVSLQNNIVVNST